MPKPLQYVPAWHRLQRTYEEEPAKYVYQTRNIHHAIIISYFLLNALRYGKDHKDLSDMADMLYWLWCDLILLLSFDVQNQNLQGHFKNIKMRYYSSRYDEIDLLLSLDCNHFAFR